MNTRRLLKSQGHSGTQWIQSLLMTPFTLPLSPPRSKHSEVLDVSVLLEMEPIFWTLGQHSYQVLTVNLAPPLVPDRLCLPPTPTTARYSFLPRAFLFVGPPF